MNDDDLSVAIKSTFGERIWNPPITITDVNAASTVANTSANTSYQPPPLIQGKMIQVVEEIDSQIMESRDPKEIKMSLVTKIAENMINSKMIEFTSEKDQMGLKVKIRARLFVTPDDQVRILRKAGY